MSDGLGRELDAAGITGAALRAAYTRCRALNAQHGRSFFLATRLLAPAQRPFVHALYGFARYADDIVDALDDPRPAVERANELDQLAAALRTALAQPDPAVLTPPEPTALAEPEPATGTPVLVAVADTARRHELDAGLFEAFLASMRMDTEVRDYPSFAELERYMHGSAAVIGLQLLPVLGTSVPRVDAEPTAAALGVAFQLTNFLRDVGEDLDRDRVYLPADELAAFGVDRELLQWCRRSGEREPRVRRALAHLVGRTRAVYRRAAPGIELLSPRSRPCVRAAYGLYGGILDQIERCDYDVLSRRVVVPTRRRLAIALPELGLGYAGRVLRTPVRTPWPGPGV
ncbi:MAG: phytoene/squalene synthase family protein [Actinomycetota bacterium]|nr:phytoene/squalene synthase family protein [Actinomycetota bacterium]